MKILLATDGSPHSQAASAFLQRIPFDPNRRLTILTVIEPDLSHAASVHLSLDDRAVLERLRNSRHREAGHLLEQQAASFTSSGWTVHTSIREGHVAQQILEAAQELEVNLIVMGARGLSGIQRFFLGSVSQNVVKHASCSVLVARLPGEGHVAVGKSREPEAVRTGASLRILVAFDGSVPAQFAVHRIASLPLQDHAEVMVTTVLTLITAYRMDILQHLSTAWQEERRSARAALEDAVQTLRQATSQVSMQLREGSDPSHEILELAREWQADLIVLGHQGKTGIERFFLGSVAHRMVHYAPCSVWVVKSGGSA